MRNFMLLYLFATFCSAFHWTSFHFTMINVQMKHLAILFLLFAFHFYYIIMIDIYLDGFIFIQSLLISIKGFQHKRFYAD